MNAKPNLARRRFLSCLIAALLSAVISAGLLGAVINLFHSDGIPFGNVVTAERTCRDHAFVSEREECVRRELVGPIRADRLRAVGPRFVPEPHAADIDDIHNQLNKLTKAML